MLRFVSRYGALTAVASATLFSSIAGGCSDRILIAETYDATAPSFIAGDAGDAGVVAESAGPEVLYCPTSACPDGFATCDGSRFLCDTDLGRDVDNCGACGHACPGDTGNYAYRCIDGECVMYCPLDSLDCDGIADNGCEASPQFDEHCGACDVQCDTATDPAKGCVSLEIDGKTVWQCGCPLGGLKCDVTCVDPKNDDANCGACGNKCPPNGGSAEPPPPNAYYGCVNAECGGLKCKEHYANCDQDPTNGCEQLTVSDDNCGACGIKCEGGTHCVTTPDGEPQCMCPPGLSLCVTGHDARGFDVGYCADFASDTSNCGGCGVNCSHSFSSAVRGFDRVVCSHGSCELGGCAEGRADCNDSPSDGCETNIASDPRNCGGCGIECDLAAGQACAGGRCVVAPCTPDEETTQ